MFCLHAQLILNKGLGTSHALGTPSTQTQISTGILGEDEAVQPVTFDISLINIGFHCDVNHLKQNSMKGT